MPATQISIVLGFAALLGMGAPPKATSQPKDAQGDSSQKQGQSQADKQKPRLNFESLYKFEGPTGAPKTIVRSGSRAAGTNNVTLAALATQSVGLTLSDRPTLCWYQSRAADPGQIEVVVTHMTKPIPVVIFSRSIPDAVPAGINEFPLADPAKNPDKVALRGGEEYQWAVNFRAGNETVNAFARLRYQQPDPATTEQIKSLPEPERARLFAAKGAWYDLFATMRDLRRENPDKADLATAEKQLIDQIGLSQIIARE